MGIVDEDVVKVREASDIVAIISAHTALRRVGQRWSGLCPFHKEKTPSFSVNQAEGLYYCFGCKASGDVITFVREIEHLDFVGAVEWLAAKAGITLNYTDENEGEGRRHRKRLQEVMERAVEWYHERLNAPDAGPARRYLRSRGFDKELVDRFRVGWAPDSWDELCRHLRVSDDVLRDTGLGFRNRSGRQQDFFRGRILFPIFDDQGRPVAFGGRKLPEADGPKYQNSRENTLYDKSSTLYGLNWAKADIVNANEAIVCEGYTDVIGFFRAGVPRAVATCGTALTEDHVRSLKRFTRRIVLAYDADEAGQSAVERIYEWEQRHDIEFSVLSLPARTDPDELSRSDPAALAAAVERAKPMLAFRVQRVLDAADASTPEGRARAAAAAIEVIREHPSPFLRDQYVMEVAGFCRVDETRLREMLSAAPSRPSRSRDDRRGGRGSRVPGGRGRDGRAREGRGGDGRAGDGRGRDFAARSGAPGGVLADDEPPPWVGAPGGGAASGWDESGNAGWDPSDPMWADTSPAAGRGGGRRPVGAPVPLPQEGPEVEALRLLVHRRADIEGWLRPVLFGDLRLRRAYELLASAGDLSGAIAAATDAGSDELRDLLARLAVEESVAPPDDVVSILLVAAATRAVSLYESAARASDDPLAYAPVISWLKLRLESLRGDDATMDFAPELLAWLDENSAELS